MREPVSLLSPKIMIIDIFSYFICMGEQHTRELWLTFLLASHRNHTARRYTSLKQNHQFSAIIHTGQNSVMEYASSASVFAQNIILKQKNWYTTQRPIPNIDTSHGHNINTSCGSGREGAVLFQDYLHGWGTRLLRVTGAVAGAADT